MKHRDFSKGTSVCKVSDDLGIVFGFAMLCKREGQDYVDTDGDHFSEEEMLQAATDFMAESRVAKEMHGQEDGEGTVVFAFPLTSEIAKALGIQTRETGLLIGMRPSPEVLAKFKDGTYTGFSVGGTAVPVEAA